MFQSHWPQVSSLQQQLNEFPGSAAKSLCNLWHLHARDILFSIVRAEQQYGICMQGTSDAELYGLNNGWLLYQMQNCTG